MCKSSQRSPEAQSNLNHPWPAQHPPDFDVRYGVEEGGCPGRDGALDPHLPTCRGGSGPTPKRANLPHLPSYRTLASTPPNPTPTPTDACPGLHDRPAGAAGRGRGAGGPPPPGVFPVSPLLPLPPSASSLPLGVCGGVGQPAAPIVSRGNRKMKRSTSQAQRHWKRGGAGESNHPGLTLDPLFFKPWVSYRVGG